MSVIKLLIFAGLSYLSVELLLAYAQEPEPVCRDLTSCDIRVDHLSNQEIEPFRIGGVRIDEKSPRWKEYRRAIREYDDVRDCLPTEAAKADPPQLLAFDWNRPRNRASLDVCLFRIAASLGDADKLRKWLSAFGFNAGGVVHTRRDWNNPRHGERPTTNLSAVMTAERFRELRSNWVSSIFGVEIAHSASITFSWDYSGRLSSSIHTMTVE